MIEREVHKGETLIRCDKDGKTADRVVVLTVTTFRIYTNKGSFDLEGRGLDGEHTLTECEPEPEQFSGNEESLPENEKGKS
jgi:hypothetical protein